EGELNRKSVGTDDGPAANSSAAPLRRKSVQRQTLSGKFDNAEKLQSPAHSLNIRQRLLAHRPTHGRLGLGQVDRSQVDPRMSPQSEVNLGVSNGDRGVRGVGPFPAED